MSRRFACLAFSVLALGCEDAPPPEDSTSPSPSSSPARASAEPSASASNAAGISGGGDLPPADRRSQCNRLIGIINRNVKRLERDGEDDADQAANLRRMADSMDQTEREARSETYDFEELDALRAEYARLIAEAAREARAMAVAARADDVPNMVRAEARLDRALGREKPFMRRLQQFCR